MKLYCHVENNTVTEGPLPLPPWLADKSDFDLLDLGWYYAECIRPESFVDRFEIMLPIQFDIQRRKVVCTFTKRSKTEAELTAQNLQKQTEVETDKANRLAFANTFMSSPEFSELTNENKAQWTNYVQQVSDTVTTNLGNEIWNVWFSPQPPTSNALSNILNDAEG